MKTLAKTLVVGSLVIWATGAAADPDKTFTNRDKTCEVTVPGSWTTMSSAGIALAPDKKVTATVSSPTAASSWDELKKTAKTIYSNTKVVKDTATELELQGKNPADKTDVYRAILAGDKKFCVVEVIYETGTVDAAWKIARTVKAAGK